MPPSTNRTQRKRPGDLTGVRNIQLSAQAQADKKAKEEYAARKQAEDAELRRVTEVDYSSGALEQARNDAAAGVIEETEVEARPAKKRIRVNYPVQDMTFGREVISRPEYDENGVMTKPGEVGSLRTMSFEEGVWYTVDADVADHLAYLGYVYDA